MRFSPLTTAVAALLLVALAAPPSPALEKTLKRHAEEIPGDWDARGGTCSLAYYNVCTGWVWVWSGWAAGSRLGIVYDDCYWGGRRWLFKSFHRFMTGAPANYGYTGSVSLHVTNGWGYLGEQLSSWPNLPRAGWNELNWWRYGTDPLAIVFTLADDHGWGTPVGVYSDGPHACGVCYPTTRTSNSYTWGTVDSPVNPGFNLNDGACNVEWLAAAYFVFSLDVEDESWGSIKGLYR